LKFTKRLSIFISVTRRVKGYIRFDENYVTDRRKRLRPYKVYIFLIRINSPVDLALSVRMNVEISETIKARGLRLSIQILETLMGRMFVVPLNNSRPISTNLNPENI